MRIKIVGLRKPMASWDLGLGGPYAVPELLCADAPPRSPKGLTELLVRLSDAERSLDEARRPMFD
jgi:hypothetical protein